MSRRWTDPRDGTIWMVDALPFDAGPSPVAGQPLGGWTLLFVAHHEHRSVPVGHELGVDLRSLGDRLLMGLLDAARTEE
jgi:hypothetical protein